MSVAYYTDPEYFERTDGRYYPKVSPRTTHGLVQLAVAMILRRIARDVGKGDPGVTRTEAFEDLDGM